LSQRPGFYNPEKLNRDVALSQHRFSFVFSQSTPVAVKRLVLRVKDMVESGMFGENHATALQKILPKDLPVFLPRGLWGNPSVAAYSPPDSFVYCLNIVPHSENTPGASFFHTLSPDSSFPDVSVSRFLGEKGSR
jgi:hypothetical protein